jgi:hypothetical protein
MAHQEYPALPTHPWISLSPPKSGAGCILLFIKLVKNNIPDKIKIIVIIIKNIFLFIHPIVSINMQIRNLYFYKTKRPAVSGSFQSYF